jgi:hypothetical protein
MNAGQFERITEHLQRLRLFKSRERLEALREAGESPRVELRGLPGRGVERRGSLENC